MALNNTPLTTRENSDPMNNENAEGIRMAVMAAMSTLNTEQLRELVMEPYRSFTPQLASANVA